MITRTRSAVVVAASATCLSIGMAAPAQGQGQFVPPQSLVDTVLNAVDERRLAVEDTVRGVFGKPPRIRLSDGHVDPIDVGFEDGALKISYHDDTVDPDVERDPDSVVSVATPAAKIPVPGDPAFAFLGAPGAAVWVLPEVEQEGLLFPGIATEEIDSGVFTGNQVTVRFKQVIGPEGVSLFTLGPGGEPNILVDSEDGLPDSVVLPVGTHAHQNWAFEAGGIYKIVIEASGQLAATGQQVTSSPAVLTFRVVR